ncbi:unnamed protein product [Protopolystoma xenopodis]|uniref:Secreted protein n=1 Tax=Protopolystoma xenopodis TaxID=117903 RepID=A0A448XNL2_9PLAT|nr:unnamed protein product [Protopolystoma xenopodis]
MLWWMLCRFSTISSRRLVTLAASNPSPREAKTSSAYSTITTCASCCRSRDYVRIRKIGPCPRPSGAGLYSDSLIVAIPVAPDCLASELTEASAPSLPIQTEKKQTRATVFWR